MATGTNGHIKANAKPARAAKIIIKKAAKSVNSLTKNPMTLENILSISPLNFSSSERPGKLTILFQGENKVRSNTSAEKARCTFFTQLNDSRQAKTQPGPYHHAKNSKSIT
ncbi:hypothetical protein HY857_01530 [Candidatus Saccharibacteria bacterium]|nr:hypothetical protein [Candidatus Saccharibacteria bacterium]